MVILTNKRRLGLICGVLAGAGLLLFDSLAARKKHVVKVQQNMPVPASQVIELISRVEQEHLFIPLIASVEVLERTNSSVRYTVSAVPPLPVNVRYRKWWNTASQTIFWTSERGSFGFHHFGEITFKNQDGCSTVCLRSTHWLTYPLFGRLSSMFATPVIQTNMETWLKNIADYLSEKT